MDTVLSWVLFGLIIGNLYLYFIIIRQKNRMVEELMKENIDLLFKVIMLKFEIRAHRLKMSLTEGIDDCGTTEKEK
jgi:hypothetical protein